ncbi:MAG: hypothetical protein R8K21_05625 [Mariprofundales bacterium]
MLALLCFILIACGQQDDENLHVAWHPTTVAANNDAHGSDKAGQLPTWAATTTGIAELTILNKTTARLRTIQIDSYSAVSAVPLQLNVLGLAHGLRISDKGLFDDPLLDNPAAFIEVRYEEKIIYRGWLYRDFPELFGLDNPDWRIWLKTIQFAAPINTRARSSAG